MAQQPLTINNKQQTTANNSKQLRAVYTLEH
jgi:hypothetical protein